ncbi:MAG: alpha/beta hydrolase [Desulfobacteraceae bacterium]|nr:alpha/beta hydrolase [Desulfobacteraceae bacterium]MBC2752330.1 alpha/beta hydrolase [Desulfobacteraceae bacterium]
MKKFIGYGLVFVFVVVVLLGGFYFLFPETVFKLAMDAQRRSADLVKKEVQVDGQRIVYLEGGKGETILLLHGFGGNKDAWTAFAKYFKGYHLVIPDIPGFGESAQVPTQSYDIDSQVGRIERFIGVLKLDTFHIAGNSMGGVFAATYGAAHPEKVLTITLMNTGGAPSQNKSEFVIQLEKGNNMFRISNIEDYNKLMDLIFVKRPAMPAAFRKIIAENVWIAHTEFNMKIWNDMLSVKSVESVEFSKLTIGPTLSKVQAPVLIIWGDQDKVTDIGGVAVLEKSLTNHKTVIMKDTGHVPPIEKPEETAKAYLDFLKGKS